MNVNRELQEIKHTVQSEHPSRLHCCMSKEDWPVYETSACDIGH